MELSKVQKAKIDQIKAEFAEHKTKAIENLKAAERHEVPQDLELAKTIKIQKLGGTVEGCNKVLGEISKVKVSTDMLDFWKTVSNGTDAISAEIASHILELDDIMKDRDYEAKGVILKIKIARKSSIGAMYGRACKIMTERRR